MERMSCLGGHDREFLDFLQPRSAKTAHGIVLHLEADAREEPASPVTPPGSFPTRHSLFTHTGGRSIPFRRIGACRLVHVVDIEDVVGVGARPNSMVERR